MDNISELIKNKYKEYESKAIEIRRHLHQYPEASAKEFNTQKFIIDTLNEHNIKCTKIADTGLWAVIAGEKESSNKKTILIRADIDALQIQEETGLDFSSKNPGLMHACGHDGHITNLIISSFILYDLRKEFSGNAKIVFQPSEEVGGGAERMINQGVLENPKVDAAIGLHISATDDANNLYTKYDGFWAAPDIFKIAIIGFGGHGAIPHKTIDPINIAAQFISSAQNIITRRIDPADPVVISFCKFNSGEVFNAIPTTALIEGTFRTVKNETRQFVKEKLEQVLKSICEANDAKYTYEYIPYYPPVINNNQMVDSLIESASKQIDKKDIHLLNSPLMVGDDFAYFGQHVPAVYFMIGCYDGTSEKYGLHNSKFYFKEENFFPSAITITVQSAIDFLNKN